MIRATTFGAVEGGDCTAAVQAAINHAMNVRADEVLIDVRRATLSDTLVLGGGAFRTLRLRGLGTPYSDAVQHSGTAITFLPNDRPAVSIVGGRDTHVSDMTLIGAAHDGILTIPNTGLDPTLEATWDAAMGVVSDRFNPYAAIVIDALPGEPRSHSTFFSDLTLKGWEVGIAQTPADDNKNGDFPRMDRVRFEYVKWAFSNGNNQCRNVTFNQCQFGKVWTCLTNRTHGQQTGTFSGLVINCGFGGFIGRLFDFTALSYSGGLAFQSCHMESLHRLGDIAGNATSSAPIWLRDCVVNFRHSSTNGHPSNVLDANGARGAFGVSGGQLFLGAVASFQNANLRIESACNVNLSDKPTEAYGQMASNALAGGVVVPAAEHVPELDVVYTQFDVDALSSTGSADIRRKALDRRFGVPIYARHGQPVPVTIRSRADTRSGRLLALGGNYRVGEVLRDRKTGTVAYVRSASEAVLQNNYIETAEGFDLLDSEFDPSTGAWDVIASGVYYTEDNPIDGDDGLGDNWWRR